jgi:CBS domain-containing protein
MQAKDIMTPEPVRIKADATLPEALTLLALADVRHLPVIDGVRVAGMLSERDVLGLLAPGERPALEELDKRCVRDLMSEEVLAVTPETPVRQIIEELLAHRVGALLVMEGEQLAGIVSYVDVLAALMDHLPEG